MYRFNFLLSDYHSITKLNTDIIQVTDLDIHKLYFFLHRKKNSHMTHVQSRYTGCDALKGVINIFKDNEKWDIYQTNIC